MNEDYFDEIEQRFKNIENGKKPAPPVVEATKVEQKEETKEETEEEMVKKAKLSKGNFIEILLANADRYNTNLSHLTSDNGFNSIIYRNALVGQPLTAKILNIIGTSSDEERGNLILDVEVIATPKNHGYPRNILQLRIYQSSITKKYIKAPSDYDIQLIDSAMECEEYGKKFRAEKKRKFEEEKKAAEDAEKARIAALAVYTDKLKEMAEFFHPDCWSLDELTVHDYTPSSGYKWRLTIKFPEFTITNSRKSNHFIKDMYIALHFNADFVLYSSLVGRRGTLTYEEYQSNYGHSHMKTGNNDWNKMCVGSETPLAEALQETSIKRKWDEDGVRKVLALLHGYINWESLEGTPYIRMTDISRKNTSLPTASDVTINTAYVNLINRLKTEDNRKDISLKLTTINNFNKFIFTKEDIEKALVSCVTSDYLVYKATDGAYVSLGGNIERLLRDIATINDQNKRDWSTNKLIKWQGKYLTPTVVLNYNGMDNLVKVPTPNLTESVFRMLEREINNYNLKNKKYELG